MAEGFAHELGSGLIEPFSAEITPCYVHPVAIRVMSEAGIDISGQRSTAIDPRLLDNMDFLVTLCNYADTYCPPLPPKIKRVHMPVNDPVGTAGTENEILHAFRKTRDEIKEEVEGRITDLRRISIIMKRRPGNSAK